MDKRNNPGNDKFPRAGGSTQVHRCLRPPHPTPPPKMIHSFARQALRQRLPAQTLSKRFNSSTSENAKKAQDALASAQATAARVLSSVQKALGPVGEKAGNLLGCALFFVSI